MPTPTPEQLLPHRPPFLFIDEIVSVDADAVHCRFSMPTEGDSFALRMFPETLLIEALAQATAVHVGANSPDAGPVVGLLGGVEGLTFQGRPAPGETVELRARLQRRLGPVAMFDVSADRGSDRRAGGGAPGAPLCRGTLTVRSGGVP